MPTRSKSIEFLATTKLGKKGQITVPKQFREDLGFGIGARVDVLRVGDALVVLREGRSDELLREEFLATLPAVRKRLYARRYGKQI